MEGFTQAIGEKEENFVLVDRIKVITRIIAIDRGDEILSEIELQVMEL